MGARWRVLLRIIKPTAAATSSCKAPVSLFILGNATHKMHRSSRAVFKRDRVELSMSNAALFVKSYCGWIRTHASALAQGRDPFFVCFLGISGFGLAYQLAFGLAQKVNDGLFGIIRLHCVSSGIYSDSLF